MPSLRLAQFEHLASAEYLAHLEYKVLPRLVAPFLATLFILSAGSHAAKAASNTFVIADNEGYGIIDCITDGKACGKIVADAWCEAHGLGSARSFGRASDVTGAIPVSAGTPTSVDPGAAVVACND